MSFSRSNFVSHALASYKNFGLFFKHIGFQNVFASLGLNSLGSCLYYKKFPCYAIFRPFDIHGPGFSILFRVMIFDSYCIPCKFEHFFIINTETKPISFRNLHVLGKHFGVAMPVDHFDLFVPYFFHDNWLISFPESRLKDIELIWIDLAQHDIFSKPVCACNENHVFESGFSIQSKNNTARS